MPSLPEEALDRPWQVDGSERDGHGPQCHLHLTGSRLPCCLGSACPSPMAHSPNPMLRMGPEPSPAQGLQTNSCGWMLLVSLGVGQGDVGCWGTRPPR